MRDMRGRGKADEGGAKEVVDDERAGWRLLVLTSRQFANEPHHLPEGDGIRRLADRRKLINLHFCTFEAFHHRRLAQDLGSS